jgi:glycosyltransferase involved in cell wall biosynthesis
MSICEGFGLPPLEAMQCGTPVICSNTTSLPEVVGDAGILVSPMDRNAICQAMLSLYKSFPLREELKKKSLKRASQFSWQKFANQTWDVYQKIG